MLVADYRAQRASDNWPTSGLGEKKERTVTVTRHHVGTVHGVLPATL